jgi:hypothetical protein
MLAVQLVFLSFERFGADGLPRSYNPFPTMMVPSAGDLFTGFLKSKFGPQGPHLRDTKVLSAPACQMAVVDTFVAMPAARAGGLPCGRGTDQKRSSREKGEKNAVSARLVGLRFQCCHGFIDSLLGLGLGQTRPRRDFQLCPTRRQNVHNEELLQSAGTKNAGQCFIKINHFSGGVRSMRGVLLWLVGIPIPIIILLYLFNVV